MVGMPEYQNRPLPCHLNPIDARTITDGDDIATLLKYRNPRNGFPIVCDSACDHTHLPNCHARGEQGEAKSQLDMTQAAKVFFHTFE
ncbi:hypothetical protein D3C72_1720090 [compost metagenome]